jgi:hypothetical protein
MLVVSEVAKYHLLIAPLGLLHAATDVCCMCLFIHFAACCSTYQLHLTVAKEALNRGWQRNFHRLAGMHWDIRHAAGILPNETRSQLSPLWNYTFTLPQSQLQRSLVYIGPNHRLRRVLLGLQQGQPTKVGVIGGSISHGASASKIGQTDWFSLVGKFLVGAYPQAKVGLVLCSSRPGAQQLACSKLY